MMDPRQDLQVAPKIWSDVPREKFGEGTTLHVAQNLELVQIGQSVTVNPYYFLAIDRHSEEEDTILMCRWLDFGGSIRVEQFPNPTDEAGMDMYSAEGFVFEEMV